MKPSLAQLRAAHALNACKVPGIGAGQKGGDTVSGFPVLIRTDGLMTALAFALEPGKNGPKHEGAYKIVAELAKHLNAVGIAKSATPEKLIEEVANDSGDKLRRFTTEAIAFLNYLKRFVA